MKCTCGSKLNTKDNELITEGMWRRRQCPKCGLEFTTIEQFCVTHRGNGGFGSKHKQVFVNAAPEITEPMSIHRDPRQLDLFAEPVKKAAPHPFAGRILKERKTKPKPPSQPSIKERSARHRIEDLKMEKRDASIFD